VFTAISTGNESLQVGNGSLRAGNSYMSARNGINAGKNIGLQTVCLIDTSLQWLIAVEQGIIAGRLWY
jgi:hypothetical protein